MQAREETSPSNADLFQSAINKHWSENRGVLLKRVIALESAVGSILAGELDAEIKESCRREAHKLKGSLGTFGLSRASAVAGELEALFEKIEQGSSEQVRLAGLVVELRAIVEASPTDELPATATQPMLGPEPNTVQKVVIVSQDAEFAERLSAHLGAQFSITTIGHFEEGFDNDQSFHVVIDGGSNPDAVAADMFEARSQGAQSITVVGQGISLKRRVALSKLGASQIISRSEPIQVIAEGLTSTIDAKPEKQHVVLIVDDDEPTLDVLTAVISPHVRELHSLADPTTYWDVLEEVKPDIVLIDYDMPQMDGIDLLRATRTESKFSKTHIVVLTGHDDPKLIKAIYAAGADDHVVKPLTTSDLLNRVLGPLSRQDVDDYEADEGTADAAVIPFSVSPDEKKTFNEDNYTHDIAIVDDDDIVGGLLSESLSTQNYAVTWLKDGDEAVGELCGVDARVKPRLVLLDVDMPGRNGLDVLRHLVDQEVLGKSKVMMLTGRSTEAETLEALRIGASDHLSKPFSLAVLIEKIRAVIKR